MNGSRGCIIDKIKIYIKRWDCTAVVISFHQAYRVDDDLKCRANLRNPKRSSRVRSRDAYQRSIALVALDSER